MIETAVPGTTAKRAAWTASIALAVGLVIVLIAFVVAVVYAFSQDGSLSVPGILEYTQTADSVSIAPSSGLPVTFLLAAVVAGAPIGWMVSGKVVDR